MIAELNTPTILNSQFKYLRRHRLCVQTHNTIKVCLTKDGFVFFDAEQLIQPDVSTAMAFIVISCLDAGMLLVGVGLIQALGTRSTSGENLRQGGYTKMDHRQLPLNSYRIDIWDERWSWPRGEKGL